MAFRNAEQTLISRTAVWNNKGERSFYYENEYKRFYRKWTARNFSLNFFFEKQQYFPRKLWKKHQDDFR